MPPTVSPVGKSKPRTYRVTIVEYGTRATRLQWLLSDVVVRETSPRHWRLTRNRTGKLFVIKP